MPTPTTTPTRAPRGTGGLDIRVTGVVSDAELDHAYAMISAVLHESAADYAQVRMTAAKCIGGPGLVQVNLRIFGAPARVQVPGRTVALAVSTAADRLRRQIQRLSAAWESWPWPDPERRALAVPGAGSIARLKSFRLHVGKPCQAAAFLNAMDYDVLLYTDAETGEDAVIYRAGPTGLCLARQRTMRPPTLPSPLPLTVNPRKIPTLTPVDAAARLAEHWLPFVFYTDQASRRGSLLYRRYDGDLGLITPIGQ